MTKPALLAIACCAALSASALTVKFTNENLDFADSDVYVMFRSGVQGSFSAGYSGGAISLTTSYTFAELSGGVSLTSVISGNIFVSLGQRMSQPVTNPAGQLPNPSPVNPTDPDYSTRWDMVELTFTGQPFDAADLTGINMFSLPFLLRTWNGTGIVQSLGYHVDADTMIAKLQAAATNDSAVLRDASNVFLRVLGPTAYAAGTIGPYRPLQDYVDAVRVDGTPILIADLFSTSDNIPPRKVTQDYDFVGHFTNIAGTETIMLEGGSSSSNGIGPNHTVAITNLAYQIYGNDPHYTIDGSIDGSMADNDVYSAVVRDVFAGFAAGFMGSTATDQLSGLQFKYEASSNWFNSAQTQAFSDVQATLPYYNAYGEAFWRYSDVYGFPFADRLQAAVQANLDPARVDTLEIVVQTDLIPEPAAAAAAAFGALLAALRRSDQ